MKNLIIFPDFHSTLKEPFHLAQKEFLKYVKTVYTLNKDYILLSLGDFFDKYNPEPKLVSEAIHFLENETECEHIILAGNNTHEVNNLTGQYAIQNLEALERIKCIYEIRRMQIDNLNILLIPAIPDKVWRKQEYKSFQEYLEMKIATEYNDMEFDYVFGHLNITESMFSDFVNIDFINCKKENIICGHIHNKFLGSVLPMSIADTKYTSQIASINTETKAIEKFPIPQFLQYNQVTYPNDCELTETDGQFTYYNYFEVLCEDSKIAEKYYKDKYGKGFCIYKFMNPNKNVINEKEEGRINEQLRNKDYLKLYCQTNTVRASIYKYLDKKLGAN